jgi:serine/threonine-protein kinase
MALEQNLAHAAPSPERLAQLLAGTRYRALALLGRGAQGLVVDAEHIALGKPVVIKVMQGKHGLDPRLAERMQLEAQVLARLSSPHLVAVHDVGALIDGRPYFVMDKLRGRTVKAEVRARGPLPVAEAIEIARQVLVGLGTVHRAGLVHRDVKPDNVFLCDAEPGKPPLVKLLDFGIAKVVPNAQGSVVGALAPTVNGIAIGTPRFLSPEQACGNPVDGRADLYATGVLLFWMLTGKDPFAHHTAVSDVLLAHVTEPAPRVAKLAPSPVPAALEHAIARALQKLPEQRFASAKDFEDELAAVVREEHAANAASDVATLRMGGSSTPPGSAAGKTAVMVGGGTVRMVNAAGRPLAKPAGRSAEGAPLARFLRTAPARPVVSWLGAAALVAAAFAGLTVLLLLAARLAGFLK